MQRKSKLEKDYNALSMCIVPSSLQHTSKKKSIFIYFYREGKGGRKRGRGTVTCKRNIDWLFASRVHLTGDLACSLGMCRDWELYQWPFSSQASTQSTQSHHPGLQHTFIPVSFYAQMNSVKLYLHYRLKSSKDTELVNDKIRTWVQIFLRLSLYS